MANTLGVVSVDIVGDLSKLDGSLKAALSSANTAGAQIGAKISAGVASGLGDSAAVDSYWKNLAAHADVFKASMENVFTSLDSHRQAIARFGGELQSLGGKMSIGITAPLVALGAASIKSSADIDSLYRGLTAVAGSAEGARAQFADLVEVAKLPGLGLQEAVQGSVRLQAFGFSSKEAKDALLSFGNAIATVGGGKADLDRVIVQLGQMAGAGKVLTQDLRPIIQTVPQVAGILKANFGPEVLSDPAKRFEALGLSAKDVVAVLTTELGKLPKVTGGLKNDLENFSDAMTSSLAKLGDAIAPIAGPVMNGLATAIKTAVDLFTAMPGPVKTVAIGIAGITAAAGPAIFTLGGLARGVSDVIALGAKWAEYSRNAALAAEAMQSVATAGAVAETAVTGAGAAAGVASTAFRGMGLALTGLGLAATAAAGVFAGWALAEWLDRNTEAFHNFTVAIADWRNGNSEVSDQERELTRNNAELAAGLKEMGVTVARLSGETLEEYTKRLHTVAEETVKLGAASNGVITIFSNTTGSLNTLGKAAGEAMAKQALLTANYKEAKEAIAQLTEKQKYGVDVTVALQVANKELKSAYDALHPTIKAVDGSTGELLEKQKKLVDAHTRAQAAIDALMKMQAQGKDVTIALRFANDDLNKSLEGFQKAGLSVLPVFDAMAGRATDATNAMSNMFAAITNGSAAATVAFGNFSVTTENGVKVIRGMRTETEGASKAITGITSHMENGVKVFEGAASAQRSLATATNQTGASLSIIAPRSRDAETGIENLGAALQVLDEQGKVVGVSLTSSLAAVGETAKRIADEIQLAATRMKNAADMASGFKASGGQKASDFSAGDPKYGTVGNGGNAGSGTMFSAETSGLAPVGAKAGDIKAITGEGGTSLPMGGTGQFNSLAVSTWSDIEIEQARVVRLLQSNGYKATELGKLMRQALDAKISVDQMIGIWNTIRDGANNAAKASESMKKAADDTAPSVQDLADQLWRLIDAGQGNTDAAMRLRAQINGLSSSYDGSASAAARASASIGRSSGAFAQSFEVIDKAVQAVVQSTKQAIGYVAPNLTPTSPMSAPAPYKQSTGALLGPNPYAWYGPSVPGTNVGEPMQQSGGVNFYLPPGDAYSIGQSVTRELTKLAGYN